MTTLYPHPTGGEIEECVKTPEKIINRDWQWRSYYVSIGCTFNAGMERSLELFETHGQDQFLPKGKQDGYPAEFLLYEFEVEVLEKPFRSDEMFIRVERNIHEYPSQVLASRPYDSFERRSGCELRRYISWPHPIRLKCTRDFRVVFVPRQYDYRQEGNPSKARIWIHGYHGLLV